MYEETDKKFLTKDLILLILKLVFLAIFIFIICWLFLRNNKGTVIKENDKDFIININAMKESAFEYFTKENLPSKNGQSIKLTLEEMINQKLLIDFTNNGQTCSLNESYVQATKTADENYALKVNLKCQEKEDYIVTTIENKDIVCQTCEKENPTETDTPISDNTSTNTEVQNKPVSSNSSSTSSKSTSTKVTTKVVTKVTYHYTWHSFCGQSCDNSKVKYYEIVQYGPWENGRSKNPGYENKCENVVKNEYCKTKTQEYFSNCTVPADTTNNSHSFTLEVPFDSANNPYVVRTSYYSSISDYQSYLDAKKNKPTDNFTQTFPNLTPTEMMNSALKNNNFTILSENHSLSNKTLTLKYNLQINNKNNVTPYYSSKLGYNVMFIPLKITVSAKLTDTCFTDLADNAYKYKDYGIYSSTLYQTCYHRKVQYKWVSENELANYLNQGWSKTGKTKTETI